jgi:Raf kinase inhibitor-like YbhB/YbcL family protein
MTLALISPAFSDNAAIPARYTCEGDDVSPPLSWSGAPPATRSFVLIVDDPDAPDPKAPRMTWVHWVVYDLPATATGLAEGVESLPGHAKAGLNDWKRSGYGGPCPPIGRHRYFHKLYALDKEIGELESPTKQDVLDAMQGHILAEAVMIGTYAKHKA